MTVFSRRRLFDAGNRHDELGRDHNTGVDNEPSHRAPPAVRATAAFASCRKTEIVSPPFGNCQLTVSIEGLNFVSQFHIIVNKDE